VLVPSGRHDDAKDVADAIAETGGADRVTLVHCAAHRDYEFKTLQQIADEQKTTPVAVYMQVVRDGGATVVGQSMKEEDIRVFYTQPWVMVGSDGGTGLRHPRGAGSYPRILGRYVCELRWLTLEEAIRKMTSLPAARLRVSDRGLIKAGMKADLVLFDAARVIDRSTFQNPGEIAEGLARVFVNGVEVWRDRAVTGAKPGRPVRNGMTTGGLRTSEPPCQVMRQRWRGVSLAWRAAADSELRRRGRCSSSRCRGCGSTGRQAYEWPHGGHGRGHAAVCRTPEPMLTDRSRLVRTRGRSDAGSADRPSASARRPSCRCGGAPARCRCEWRC
jgi:hypothetical protein